MFACNTGAKTPKNNCSKIINMFVGGATIECTYAQDNSAITNLNHEGWTCTGLSQVGFLFKNSDIDQSHRIFKNSSSNPL